MALIGIAHPDFRERLLREAIALKYLRPDKSRVGKVIANQPGEFDAEMILSGGTQVFFRSIRPTDESAVKDLLFALSRETVYYRFMSGAVKFTPPSIQDFVFIDHRKDVCIAGATPETHGDLIVAVGRYYLDPGSNHAEVAFVIRDDWQGRGIGKFLFHHLATIAKRNGIAGFTAETLGDNKRMRAIFNKSGMKVQSDMKEGVVSYKMDFE
jgi:GNAT superfamily N-acetyltransferase